MLQECHSPNPMPSTRCMRAWGRSALGPRPCALWAKVGQLTFRASLFVSHCSLPGVWTRRRVDAETRGRETRGRETRKDSTYGPRHLVRPLLPECGHPSGHEILPCMAIHAPLRPQTAHRVAAPAAAGPDNSMRDTAADYDALGSTPPQPVDAGGCAVGRLLHASGWRTSTTPAPDQPVADAQRPATLPGASALSLSLSLSPGASCAT